VHVAHVVYFSLLCFGKLSNRDWFKSTRFHPKRVIRYCYFTCNYGDRVQTTRTIVGLIHDSVASFDLEKTFFRERRYVRRYLLVSSWLPKELPDCYLSHDLSSPRPHFPAIIRPSSFVAGPLLHSGSSSSPAIAVNPQANLLSISICRVAGQLNIRALACSTYAYPGFSLSSSFLLLPGRMRRDWIRLPVSFLVFQLIVCGWFIMLFMWLC